MLTPHQKDWIAEEINKAVNIPIIGEKGEYKIFRFAIEKIDSEVLDKYLPEEFKNFFNLADGFEWSQDDETECRVGLLKTMDENINLLFVNRETRRSIFGKAAQIITNGLKKGQKI